MGLDLPEVVQTGGLMEHREADVWARCFVMVLVWGCASHMDAAQRE